MSGSRSIDRSQDRIVQIIAKRVELELERRGWNGSELARRSGLEPGTISRIRNKKMLPNPDVRKAMCDAFGIEEDDLLNPDPSDVYLYARWLKSIDPDKRDAALDTVSKLTGKALPKLPWTDEDK